ncbi:MAG TPA: SURF1 family protein [Gemmatimonadales bacterium]|nr:SURF1 family protein [Gemmatimonadales bacterium]
MRSGTRFALIAVCLIAAAGATGLGFWQLGRLQARRAANRIALAGRTLPPVSLNALETDDSLSQRRATASGTFDYSHAFILRGRVEREAPGVHLVVPMKLSGRDAAVLVHRGFVPADDALRPDTSTIDVTPGERTVEGILVAVPDDPEGAAPVVVKGDTTWHRLDRATVRARLPYPALEVYLFETTRESRPDTSRPWPVLATLPALDDGPHLSYIVQWWGIAAAAVAFAVIFGRRATSGG